ncbi:hypothetical protein GGF32_008639, partial [Allomyces javanicus]
MKHFGFTKKQVLCYVSEDELLKQGLTNPNEVWADENVRVVIITSCAAVGINFSLENVFHDVGDMAWLQNQIAQNIQKERDAQYKREFGQKPWALFEKMCTYAGFQIVPYDGTDEIMKVN